jgi:hypothetical protein
MDHPARTRSTTDYVQRLVDRLHLLHECYEQAMAALQPVPAAVAPVDREAAR